jgi:hypothetical protein
MTQEEKRKYEKRFVEVMRQLISADRPLTPGEMASLFEEDGYLGSEMRAMLLEEKAA